MSRAREAHAERRAAVAALGKDLTRRSGSRCELCGGEGDLRPLEVEPVGEEPSTDRAMLACARCREVLEEKRPERRGEELRFLEAAVWSETLPARLCAVRLLRRLAAAGTPWAVATADGLWLPEEVEELL